MIKPGDQVMLVWGCCANVRKDIGWIGDVKKILHVVRDEVNPCICGFVFDGMAANIIDDDSVVPPSWLIKLDPPAVTTEKREEVEA